MKPCLCRLRRGLVSHTAVSLAALALLAGLVALPTGAQPPGGPDKRPADPKKPPLVEVRFADDTALKMTLLDEKLELTTQYGTLQIPVRDVRRIDFATRVSDADVRRIETLIALLADKEYGKRQDAFEELQGFGSKAYPHLLKAAKSSDKEVQRRAEELIDQIKQNATEDQLEVRPNDVVHTADSKISGKLTATTLKVNTTQFGEQQLRLTELRSLQGGGVTEVVADKNVLPDPGHLRNYSQFVGKTFYFRVIGAPAGTGGVYGTEVYSTDSPLAAAAVHAGAVRSGQTGVVKVTIIGPVPALVASTQNGITSAPYGQEHGFRVHK